jgi:hypothetical protein
VVVVHARASNIHGICTLLLKAVTVLLVPVSGISEKNSTGKTIQHTGYLSKGLGVFTTLERTINFNFWPSKYVCSMDTINWEISMHELEHDLFSDQRDVTIVNSGNLVYSCNHGTCWYTRCLTGLRKGC